MGEAPKDSLAHESGLNAAIARIAKTYLSAEILSIEDLSHLILEEAKRLTKSPFGYVGYIAPDTGYLISPTLTRDIWKVCQIERKSVVFKEFRGLFGWVLNNKKPLLTNSPAEDPRATGTPPGHVPIKRFLSAPALIKNNLVGQIALANAPRDYTENDLQIIGRLADFYAMVIQRQQAEEAIALKTKELEDHCKLLDVMTDQMVDMVYYKDKDCRYLFSSKPHCDRILKISPEDCLGKTDAEIASIARQAGHSQGFGEICTDSDYQTRDAGIPCQYTEIAEIDGEEIWLEVFKTPIYDGTGEFQGIVGCSRDVTQRRWAEEALRESEQNFRSLFETIHDCIFVIDETGTILEVNQEVVRRLGYQKTELLGAHILQVHPLDLQAKATEVLSKIFQGEADFCDVPIMAKDGTLIQVETIVTKGRWGDREVFFGISRDITERQRAEERLREEYSSRKGIIERAAEGLCVCHATAEYPNVKFTVWNDRMIEITGYSMEEINRLGCYQTLYPDPETREKARLRMEHMRQGNDLHSEEWEITRADGEKRILNISTSQLITSDNMVHTMALILDVTERQQAEEALRKSHQELEHRVAERTAELFRINQELRVEVAERRRAEGELQQYKDQLEKLVEERTAELVKVNKRLRALGSELTLAEERERRRLAAHLHDHVGQLLALVKIKLGEGLRKSPTDISNHSVREALELIDQVIQFTRSLTFELSLTVLYDLGLGAAIEWLGEQFQKQYDLQIKVIREGPENLLDDAAGVLLFRIVRELLTNVLKHAQANQVLITLQSTGEHIHLQVADNGIGFDRSKVSMFSGFGLFNIQERLGDLGGYLDLQTVPGKGTSAAIVVPVEKITRAINSL